MMTHKSWIFIWSVGLITGFGLVTASLVMNVGASSPDVSPISHSKLYFSTKLLPDHTFYPALMAIERAKLAITPDQEKPEMLLELAELRLESARELAEKGELQLAEQTLYKSHLYLMQVGELVKNHNRWSYALALSQGLNNFASLCPTIKEQINPSDPALFDQMQVENRAVREQIANLLLSEH